MFQNAQGGRKTVINEPLWFNKTFRILVSTQRKIYNRYKRSRNPCHLAKYRKCRRENKNVFQARHYEYMCSRLYKPLSEEDSKTSRFLKAKRGNSNHIKLLKRMRSGELLDNPAEIAGELNDKSAFKSDG